MWPRAAMQWDTRSPAALWRTTLRIIDELKDRLECDESMFRAQLMREDIARLERLLVIADE